MLKICDKYFIYTLIITSIWTIWNVKWINNNYEYSGFDVLGHLSNEKDVLADISSEFKYNGTLNGIKRLLQIPREGLNWPHLTYLISSIFEIGTGYCKNAVFYSNFMYVFIIIFSVFSISKKISNSSAGFYSVLSLLIMPGFIGFTRLYSLDLPLGTITILTIALFLRFYDNLSLFKSFILGIVISIGVLLRPQYLLYISLPLIIFSIFAIRKKELPEFLPFIPIISGFFSLYYWLSEYNGKLDAAFNELFLHIGRDVFKPEYKFGFDLNYKPFGIEYFLYYIKVYFVNSGIINSCLFTPLIICSTFIAIKRKIQISPYMILIITSVWIYLLLSSMSSKVPKYFMVEYPLIATISGCTIDCIHNKIIKYIIHLFIFTSIIFNIMLSHSPSFYSIISAQNFKMFGPSAELWTRPADGEEYTNTANDISTLLKSISHKKPYPYVCILPEIANTEKSYYIEIQYKNLIYLIRQNFLPWLSSRVLNPTPEDIERLRSKAILPLNYAMAFKNNSTEIICNESEDVLILVRQIDNTNNNSQNSEIPKSERFVRIYKSPRIKGLQEYWTDAIVEMYISKDLN